MSTPSSLDIIAQKKAAIATLKVVEGCMDCGYNTRADALDFDHRPGTVKLFSVGRGITFSWARLLDEVDKCDVVCATCHRVRTNDRKYDVGMVDQTKWEQQF